MATEILGQKINGDTYGYSSIEFNINGIQVTAVSEIEYSSELTPGEVRGTSVEVLATTAGEGSHSGKITLTKGDANAIKASLGNGFMRKKFPITVKYAEEDEPIIVDELFGVRFTNTGNSHSAGGDGLMVSFDLYISRAIYDGFDPFNINP